jgi:hypothetical protein
VGAVGYYLTVSQSRPGSGGLVIERVFFLPSQNSLCLRTFLTITLADALRLARDCHCEERSDEAISRQARNRLRNLAGHKP